MKRLQITIGMASVIIGIYTIVAAIMYLNRMIDNLGFCMIGMICCLLANCVNCIIMCLNLKKKKE